MDVIALAEMSEKRRYWIPKHVEMDEYQKFHTASKSSKEGTAIYVKKNFATIERLDLNINSLEYESMWKLKTKGVKTL